MTVRDYWWQLISQAVEEQPLAEEEGVIGGAPIAWVNGADVIIRPTRLVQWARRRARSFTRPGIVHPPGGARQLKAWLAERYNTYDDRSGWGRITVIVGAATDLAPLSEELVPPFFTE